MLRRIDLKLARGWKWGVEACGAKAEGCRKEGVEGGGKGETS